MSLDVPLPLIANFAASTFVVLLRWWFEQDLHQTPEESEIGDGVTAFVAARTRLTAYECSDLLASLLP